LPRSWPSRSPSGRRHRHDGPARRLWGFWPAAADDLAGVAVLAADIGAVCATLGCPHGLSTAPQEFSAEPRVPMTPDGVFALLACHRVHCGCRCVRDVAEFGRLTVEMQGRRS
jgi:hypothetical protein